MEQFHCQTLRGDDTQRPTPMPATVFNHRIRGVRLDYFTRSNPHLESGA
jgi:hypothetical protein